jgi:predicted helicase
MLNIFETYYTSLQSQNLNEVTEHTFRPALQKLLEEIAATPNIKILHEGKQEGKFGRPDFKITSVEKTIGYVENKKINENLNKVLKSEQIQKYKQLSGNILLTNYIDWIWIKNDEITQVSLCRLSDIESKKAALEPGKAEAVLQVIKGFFSFAPEGIATPGKLADALAVRARLLKDFLLEELIKQAKENQTGRLYGLYATFKDFVFSELSVSEFADAFAQNLTYGLFLAKLNADTKELNLYNVKQFIPDSFQLIRELVGFLDELNNPEYKETRWIVNEVLDVMNSLDLPEIQKNLSFNKKAKDADDFTIKDPYVYFYEDFLASYDKALRKAKGVYYTPPPVVNFIVRAIDDVLQDVFEISEGLADRKQVTVLDFATGTGTFLIEILQQIFEKVTSPAKRELIIREHILKNIYGFEYLIAPYTIAHLKLSQFLKENNYNLADNERFNIFLTNTLEPIDKQMKIPLLPALTKESREAQHVKDKPILVITGNPPYSINSKNNSLWIGNKIKTYYQVDGKPLGERNPKALQDDYVKFIRFAQDKIDNVEQGLVAIITNHSFLDNPTFRGMRQSLMQTFDVMYFIDLHGNAKKKEQTPEGGRDENVFDIEQGVAVSIMIKSKGLKKQIFHTDFWGRRGEKYKISLASDLKNILWNELRPNSPFYLFEPQNQNYRKIYDSFFCIKKEIFRNDSMGVTSGDDKMFVSFNEEELGKRIQKEFGKTNKDYLKKYTYRVLDNRVIYYDTKLIDRAREEIMNNLLTSNYAVTTIRNSRSQQNWNFVFVSNLIIDKSVMSSLDNANIFPLYLYEKKQGIFTEIDPPQKVLTQAEIDFERKTQDYREAENEFLRYKKLFDNYVNPSHEEKDKYEEFKTVFEKLRALFESNKTEFEAVQKRVARQEKDNLEDGVEILDDYIKTENFTKEFKTFIREKYTTRFTPEQILSYIYAVLHSPVYRNKYAEFLKIDFPRIPFTDEAETFEKMAILGWELIQTHLQNKIPKLPLGIYEGEGNNEVDKPVFVQNTALESEPMNGKLRINKTQYFDKVPADVYKFQIGGYQVLDKYLKDRKGRTLSLDEIENVEGIVKILAFTLTQMQKIEELTQNWI